MQVWSAAKWRYDNVEMLIKNDCSSVGSCVPAAVNCQKERQYYLGIWGPRKMRLTHKLYWIVKSQKWAFRDGKHLKCTMYFDLVFIPSAFSSTKFGFERLVAFLQLPPSQSEFMFPITNVLIISLYFFSMILHCNSNYLKINK